MSEHTLTSTPWSPELRLVHNASGLAYLESADGRVHIFVDRRYDFQDAGPFAEKLIRACGLHDELVRALRALVVEAGSHGYGPNDTEEFYCEYCEAHHPDFHEIEHRDDCLVTKARAVLAKAEGRS